MTAALTVFVGFFVINPYLPFYSATAIGIVLGTEALYRYRLFDSLVKAIVSGLLISVIAAILSAPVTAFVFGGNTLSGVDMITAFLMASGQNVLQSVLITGFTSEPVDKSIVCVLAYVAIKGLPERLTKALSSRRIPKS